MTPAYAAGLIDGEGSIGSHQRKSRGRIYYTARVQIGMSLPGYPALWAMRESWGGSLSRTRQRTDTWEEAWTWTVQGPGAAEMLRAILPHLLVKREQAFAALEIEIVKERCERHPNGRPMWTPEAEARCLEMRQVLHRLNRKGPAPALTAEDA